jgi:rhodanese-related sulfurtransferase
MPKKSFIPLLSISGAGLLLAIVVCVAESNAGESVQTPKESTSVTAKSATAPHQKSDVDTMQNRPKEITAAKLKSYLDKQVRFFLIDGRGSPYYEETIKGAVMIMENEVDLKKHLLPADKKLKIVAFCAGKGCKSSEKLCVNLMKLGYVNVENYPGGFPDWKENGYPTMVPKQ